MTMAPMRKGLTRFLRNFSESHDDGPNAKGFLRNSLNPTKRLGLLATIAYCADLNTCSVINIVPNMGIFQMWAYPFLEYRSVIEVNIANHTRIVSHSSH